MRIHEPHAVAISVVVLVILVLAIVFASFPVRSVLAHDIWINRGGLRNPAGELCCGEGDCFVIPSDDVNVLRDGYHVARRTVDRQLYAVEVVPFAEAQPSPDGAYWRCRRPDGTRRCFFAPPQST